MLIISEETNQHVQFKSVFLDHYYLLKNNKKHVSYTSKTKSQDVDFFSCGIFPLNERRHMH